jgi:hypothetical protein
MVGIEEKDIHSIIALHREIIPTRVVNQAARWLIHVFGPKRPKLEGKRFELRGLVAFRRLEAPECVGLPLVRSSA